MTFVHDCLSFTSHGKKAQLGCFFLIPKCISGTWECEHLRLERHLIPKSFYKAFPHLSMVLDPPGKVLISNNIETFFL